MSGLFFQPVDPDEAAEELNEELNEALAQAIEEARCRCEKPGPDEYTLSIDAGSIEVTHTPCGKSPWFMLDDLTDVVCMAPVPVRVDQVTGCHSRCGGNPNKMGCDCGPEVDITLPGKDKK